MDTVRAGEVFQCKTLMHALTVLTAVFSGNTFRFTVHPDPKVPSSEISDLEPNNKGTRVPLHKDSQGMLQAKKQSWAFVLDPPTGVFRLSFQQRELLSGSIQTGQFNAPLLFARHRPGETIYGFGAGSGRLRQNESSFRLLNIDTLLSSMPGRSYSSFPFFLIQRDRQFTGVFLNASAACDVHVHDGETNPAGPGTEFRFLEPTPLSIDVFVTAGTPAEILDSYTRLTGRPFLPPVWSLGFHQSRWSYRDSARVANLAERFRREDVPCDAIHLDIHYMDRYRVFTWDRTRFPDPEEMHAKLSELGIRTVAIVDPGVAVAPDYPVYAEGLKRGAFCTRSDGTPYQGRVWPGLTVFPDFAQSAVRDWWAEQHRELLGRGVSGIWNDMNDPVLKMGKRYDPLAEDVHHGQDRHAAVRNRYANYEADATTLGFAKHQPGTRPFVLTRSGTSGIQKYAALWTGDNVSSWESLRENLTTVLSLGISGVPFSGADIGGFAGRRGLLGVFKWRPSAELFVRWMQLGALLPFFRAHTTLYSPDQEPWSFGAQALRICRKHIKRRYRLLPTIYGLFRESSQNGSPVSRPMFFHYPETPPERVADQFLLGRDLLVAPVLRKGMRRRPVFLPEGDWYEYDSGTRLSAGRGGSLVMADAPLDTCPLFVRAGAMLPVCHGAHNATSSLAGEQSIEVYPGPALRGTFYADDGLSLEYQSERYLQLELSGRQDRNGGLSISLQTRQRRFQPPYKELRFRLPGEFTVMQLRGRTVQAERTELSEDDRSIIVSTFSVPLSAVRLEFK